MPPRVVMEKATRRLRKAVAAVQVATTIKRLAIILVGLCMSGDRQPPPHTGEEHDKGTTPVAEGDALKLGHQRKQSGRWNCFHCRFSWTSHYPKTQCGHVENDSAHHHLIQSAIDHRKQSYYSINDSSSKEEQACHESPRTNIRTASSDLQLVLHGTNNKEWGGERSVPNDPKKVMEKKAAIKVRRAFHERKGITRLQGLSHGDLVRGQPVYSLYCMQGILRLPTLVCGQRVGYSGISFEVEIKLYQAKAVVRRAFHERKGITRLQGLIHGDLVRRQPGYSLYCMQGILRLQALVCGQRVGHSGISFDVQTKLYQAKAVVLASSSIVKPLQIQYCPEHSNSVWNWLERWTSSQFWKSLPQPKKSISFKSRPVGHAMDATSGRQDTSKDEKPLGTNGELSSKEEETFHENPETNKQSASFSAKFEYEENGVQNTPTLPRYMEATKSSKAKLCGRDSRMFGSDGLDKYGFTCRQCMPSSIHKRLTSPSRRMQRPLQTNAKGVLSSDRFLSPSRDGNLSLPWNSTPHITNRKLGSKEEQVSLEKPKTNKPSVSFPAKSKHKENGVQNTPTLPRYMDATESSKAKLRGRVFGSDGLNRYGFTRHQYLSSSTHRKLITVTKNTMTTSNQFQGGPEK